MDALIAQVDTDDICGVDSKRIHLTGGLDNADRVQIGLEAISQTPGRAYRFGCELGTIQRTNTC